MKARVFDVFGTVVDWGGSIIEEGEACGLCTGGEPGKADHAKAGEFDIVAQDIVDLAEKLGA